MKKSNETPLPLHLVKYFGEKYPEAYEWVKKMRADPALEWNKEKCYIPISATMAIMDNIKKSPKDMNMGPTELAAFSAWRQFKEIYHFDYELAQELYLQAEKMDVIPAEAIILPFPCIFIELECDDNFQGFFAFWEQDFEENNNYTDWSLYELRFLAIGNSGDLGIYHLHILGGATLEECAKQTAKRMKRGFALGNTDANFEDIKTYSEQQTQIAARLLQLVLYICAENADIDENPEQKKITRKSSAGAQPKDVFREIRKWDVGVKIGKLIRQQKYYDGSGTGSHSGTSKRPHVRRGHYHHFWAGSEKDGTRRLILRWVAPTFINGTSEDAIVTKTYINSEDNSTVS